LKYKYHKKNVPLDARKHSIATDRTSSQAKSTGIWTLE